MSTSRRRLSFSTPPEDVSEETGKICSLCLAPHTELSEPDSWKNLQAQEIALTQLNLTLVSRVCRPCCNDIGRLINSASITPRWEKGGTGLKCCISNCHATSFATSKIATSEQISEIFPCSNIPCPTPLCKRHYHIVHDAIQSKKHIALPVTHLYATSA